MQGSLIILISNMSANQYIIKVYSDVYRSQILTVWEKSVVATHHFLSQEDFLSIKELVAEIDFNAFDVFCLLNGEQVVGFIGVASQKVEMLFLDPAFIGKGLGRKLMEFAMDELKAHSVDVNEQNPEATAFYQKLGFVTYERTEKDDQGNPYPILRMKLTPTP